MISDHITQLPSYSDEQLVHLLKQALSVKSSSEKLTAAPLITAIDKERASRRRAANKSHSDDTDSDE